MSNIAVSGLPAKFPTGKQRSSAALYRTVRAVEKTSSLRRSRRMRGRLARAAARAAPRGPTPGASMC